MALKEWLILHWMHQVYDVMLEYFFFYL